MISDNINYESTIKLRLTLAHSLLMFIDHTILKVFIKIEILYIIFTLKINDIFVSLNKQFLSVKNKSFYE